DCHRELKDPEARAIGYGRDCARKRGLLPPKKPRRTRAVRRPKPATVPPAADVPPGQTALDLFYVPVTLDSL
ncbi:MAG TPA: DUF6011 domain-containing protein, partial [Streptomyces sp.]